MGDQHRLMWTIRASELAFDHRWARVRHDTVELPNGVIMDDYYYWDGGDFAQVFAMTQENEVLLVRQYKHAIRDIVLELPGGMLNTSDEDPLVAARRELGEETGYQSDTWHSLGVLFPSSAKATTKGHAFLALDAYEAGNPTPDVSEHIEVVRCSVRDLGDAISRGEIRDSNSIAVVFLAVKALERLK